VDAFQIISGALGRDPLADSPLPRTNKTTISRPSRSLAGMMRRQRRSFIAAGLLPVLQASRITLQATVRCQALDGLFGSPIHCAAYGVGLARLFQRGRIPPHRLELGAPAAFTCCHAG
jgi:hypothetical protein